MGLDAQEMEVRVFRYLSLNWILALILVGVAGMSMCAREESRDVAHEMNKPLPDQVISDFKITETSMGKKDWSMRAEKAYLYEKRNLLEAQGIEVTFFDDKGTVQSVLSASYGKINRASDDMEARGSVVVTGSDGVILETESLSWQSASRQIVSEDSVKVIRNKDVLTGWGFRGDPDLGSFSILRNMKATIRAGRELSESGGVHDSSAEN